LPQWNAKRVAELEANGSAAADDADDRSAH
jgi:hypothetical protein